MRSDARFHSPAVRLAALAALIAAIGQGASVVRAEIRYTAKNIGALTGTPEDNRPDRCEAINRHGDTAGSSRPAGVGATTKAFTYYYADGRLINLGNIYGEFVGGVTSGAYGINDHGWVVGQSDRNAFVWIDDNQNRAVDAGEMRELVLPPGATAARAVAINNSGQVVGYVSTGTTSAWRWTDANNDRQAQPEEILVINGGAGNGINEAGSVIGTILGEGFRWTDLNNNNQDDPGETAIIPKTSFVPTGASSNARAINNHGQVVGSITNAAGGGATRGYIWTDLNNDNVADPGEVVDLNFPYGGSCHVFDVNDAGQVVGGYAVGSSRYAFVWSAEEGGRNLNDLISPTAGIEVRQAYAINNAGQIAGFARLSSGGTTEYAFLLTPAVPPDFDYDGDVDADDLAYFLACAAGPAAALTSECARADFDGDADADAADFGIFQRCMSGQDVPVRPGCHG